MDYILFSNIYEGRLIGSVMNFGNFGGHFVENMGQGGGRNSWSGTGSHFKPGLSVNTFYLDTVFTNPEFT